MSDLIINCIGYGFIAAFWVSIILASWAAYRRIRARLIFRALGFVCIVVTLLWAGLELRLIPGASAYAQYRYTRNLFGRGFYLGEPRLSYHSRRSFNGDGYSIELFGAPERLTRLANSPPPDFTFGYPIRPSYRSKWSGIQWRPTPISTIDRKFLEFALRASFSDNSDLKTAQMLLEQYANEPGHYFAYFYFMHGESVGNVDFFLLSPSKGIFIAVNSNT